MTEERSYQNWYGGYITTNSLNIGVGSVEKTRDLDTKVNGWLGNMDRELINYICFVNFVTDLKSYPWVGFGR